MNCSFSLLDCDSKLFAELLAMQRSHHKNSVLLATIRIIIMHAYIDQ